VVGFVAQIGLSSDTPLPQTDSTYCHSTRYAKSCEAVQDGRADLDFRKLSMHLGFDTASAVVSS